MTRDPRLNEIEEDLAEDAMALFMEALSNNWPEAQVRMNLRTMVAEAAQDIKALAAREYE